MNRRGPIIAAGAGVLLAVLVAVGLIFPKMNQVKTVQHQVTTAQAETATLTAQVDQLTAMAKSLRKEAVHRHRTASQGSALQSANKKNSPPRK